MLITEDPTVTVKCKTAISLCQFLSKYKIGQSFHIHLTEI